MKYIALLLGLALTAPAMAQNRNTSRTERPAVQDAKNKQGQRPAPKDKPVVKPNGVRIDPGLLRRFDTNRDGVLSNAEKLAGRRRIAKWRDRQQSGKPKPQSGDRGSRGSRGNGNGPKPQPGVRGSRNGRGNGPRPTPGTGGRGNGPKPQLGGRGSRSGRGNGPKPQPGRGSRDGRGNGPRPTSGN